MVPKHRPKQIEFIEQRKKNDCGVACVAMLVGHLYSEIIVLFPKLKRTKGGLFPDELFEIFEDLNFSYKENNVLPKKGRALVAISWNDKTLSGHYVVWDSVRKQFLDPTHGVINKRELLNLAKIDYIWRITKIKETI